MSMGIELIDGLVQGRHPPQLVVLRLCVEVVHSMASRSGLEGMRLCSISMAHMKGIKCVALLASSAVAL